MAASRVQELPEQDLEDIRACVLASCDSQGYIKEEDLFIDTTFSPDVTSLTYVYSGDDKYERMVFKRPHDLCVSPCLYGIGGLCDIRLPWKPAGDRRWFLCALAVVSLNQRHLERIIPGYRNFEQSFWREYTGAFQFDIWRFGEWTEVVVDDTLPVLDNRLGYCPFLGNPPEFWGALIEKAYAKCHRAYEAIESGNVLDALTDLTGAICEQYGVRETAPSDVFHILYKSCINRSFVVAWRHRRSLRLPGFKQDHKNGRRYSTPQDGSTQQATSEEDQNHLFIITTMTKFSLRDGTMLEMVRLKDPYCRGQPTWQGEFGPSDNRSWIRLNPTFAKNFRPKDCRDTFEFWMTYVDFSRHFADVLVCSSPDPYKGFSPEGERRYKPNSNTAFTNLEKPDIAVVKEKKTSGSIYDSGGNFLDLSCFEVEERVGTPEVPKRKQKTTNVMTKYLSTDSSGSDVLFVRRSVSSRDEVSTDEDSELTTTTTLFTATSCLPSGASNHSLRNHKSRFVDLKDDSPSGAHARPATVPRGSIPGQATSKSRTSLSSSNSRHSSIHSSLGAASRGSSFSGASSHGSGGGGTGGKHNFLSTTLFAKVCEGRNNDNRSSNVSFPSTVASALDADNNGAARHVTGAKKKTTTAKSSKKAKPKNRAEESASARAANNNSPPPGEIEMQKQCSVSSDAGSGTLTPSLMSQGSLFESHMDYFRPSGNWKELVHRFGRWKKGTAGGPRSNLHMHSKNQRVALSVPHPDSINELTPSCAHGKCHVIISLMQDYRRGARSGNNMLVSLGFSVYKAKQADSSEKRHLGRLTLIEDIQSSKDSREVTARLDLDPGFYLVVPYTQSPNQEGEFLIRILGEQDGMTNKGGCVLS